MYKYKAKLVSSQEVIAEANNLEDLEAAILGFRRKQKQDEHTRGNEKIQIIHVERDSLKGKNKSKEELVKIV
ncbi:MAG6790 family protein [Mycoplasmopsis hyopharyngis]|uniref:MAG6790 family protein n=1 Tax=Mycoplasmopsis hyopharyngis TaxID=29558 RepID=UPI003872D622